MARVSQSMVKSMNIHQSKIDVMKFDCTNNFGMCIWMVIDALNVQNLKETLLLQEKITEISEKDGDKMTWMACGVIRSYLIQDIKYHMMTKTSAKST